MLVHGHPGWDADSSLLIVVQMLTKDPAARVGLAAVMGHPWVTSGGQDPLQSMEEAGQVVRGGSALAPPRRGCRKLSWCLPCFVLEAPAQHGAG